MIHIGIATIARRQESLIDTLASLQGQADAIHVYCNDYKPPDWLVDMAGVYAYSGKDYGDAAKFWPLHRCNGVFFSCDDDLIYPEDYVDRTMWGLARYEGAIVSYHGAIMRPRWASYYGDRDGFACLKGLPVDVGVHVVGTGVMAFDATKVPLKASPILDGPRNMADIHVAIQAHKMGVPLFCLAHDEGWIQHSTKVPLGDTIWATAHKDDAVQSRLLKSVDLKVYALA